MRSILQKQSHIQPSLRAKSVVRCTLLAVLVGCPLSCTAAQTDGASTLTTMNAMGALRDEFVKEVQASGLSCSLPAPTLLVEDVPSFGQYNPETNSLRTSDWTVLQPREKALFEQLAGPGADAVQARALFEVAAHRWIFIHELGHWWEQCAGGNGSRSHYQAEYQANRVALAYWRKHDPSVVQRMMPVFQGVVDHAPSPLPPGQALEAYFNANYETLGPSPAYPWFMSKMNVAAYEERPVPTFEAVLGSIKNER